MLLGIRRVRTRGEPMEEAMAAPGTEARGPVDYMLIEFQGDRLTGRAAHALLELVDRGIVSVYDVMVVGKDLTGASYRAELSRSNSAQLGGFTELAWASSGLLTEDDAAQAAETMRPGALAALIVYENIWAIPLIAAAWSSGGQVIASARLATQDVTDALDAVEADI
jgi:hypothetical protein